MHINEYKVLEEDGSSKIPKFGFPIKPDPHLLLLLLRLSPSHIQNCVCKLSDPEKPERHNKMHTIYVKQI